MTLYRLSWIFEFITRERISQVCGQITYRIVCDNLHGRYRDLFGPDGHIFMPFAKQDKVSTYPSLGILSSINEIFGKDIEKNSFYNFFLPRERKNKT